MSLQAHLKKYFSKKGVWFFITLGDPPLPPALVKDLTYPDFFCTLPYIKFKRSGHENIVPEAHFGNTDTRKKDWTIYLTA